MLLYYITITSLLWLNESSATDNPVVEIKSGKLVGVRHENYYSFEGIPYAQPPIGLNRFESPKPFVSKWNNTRDATHIHEHCIQHPDPVSRTYEISGIEDCLYLNIYTPDINTPKLYPVIFYIHGGGFMYGSGDLLREKILMKHQNLILVTFNYRLNIFGFLSTSDTVITGNMGLKDQRLALQWVKDNIRKFNGDPDKILLTGFSAGSASVEYLTLQPGIENFAVAAVSMSGSVLNGWAFNSNPKLSAIKLGELLNCPTHNSNLLKLCLKTKSAIDIVRNVKHFRNILGISTAIFSPVVEHESVVDAIITEHPRELLRYGRFSKIPLLLSYVAEDGALFTSSIYNNISNIINSGNKYFLTNQSWLCDENCSLKDMEDVFDDLTGGSIDKLTKLFTKHLLVDGIAHSIRLRRQIEGSKTYLYYYNNPPPFGLGNLIAQTNYVNFGTNHGDDVFLVLNFPPRDAYKFRPDEERISNNFVKMWESFVTTGVPVFGDVVIPKITSDIFDFLHIKADDYQIEIFDEHYYFKKSCNGMSF